MNNTESNKTCAVRCCPWRANAALCCLRFTTNGYHVVLRLGKKNEGLVSTGKTCILQPQMLKTRKPTWLGSLHDFLGTQMSVMVSICSSQRYSSHCQHSLSSRATSCEVHCERSCMSQICLFQVITNYGDAYSGNSGIFVSPVGGLYLFTANLQVPMCFISTTSFCCPKLAIDTNKLRHCLIA